MGSDKYHDFRHLAANETLNKDYKIFVRDLGADITIIAPHGGCIERGTSVIADKIAGNIYNYYSFCGIKSNRNSDLHITSHHFDEPRAMRLVLKSKLVIAVHACIDKEEVIHMGGLFKDLKNHISTLLETAGIRVSMQTKRYPGRHPDNICNKGLLKKGVQLEISRGLRDRSDKIDDISRAVNHALNTFRLLPS